MQVSKIIFPNKPHLDPIAAYWVLLQYGAEKYQNAHNAALDVWTAGQSPDAQTLNDWKQQGCISFDIEGGTFDHHSSDKALTLLVAEDLGISENPELQSLLRYIQEDDTAGLHNNYGDLAGVLKTLYKRGDSTQDVIAFTLNVLDALQHKEKGWHVDAKAEFEAKAKVFKIKYHKNKIKICFILSDNLDVANYAKQHHGVALVIQKNSRGHVFIFTNSFFRLNIVDMVAAIRWREMELTGKTPRSGKELRAPGKTPEVQNWFFHEALNALMNGSAALADTPPTAISLEEIIDIIVFGLIRDRQNNPTAEVEYLTNNEHYYQTLYSKL